jgi:hypothetical protein
MGELLKFLPYRIYGVVCAYRSGLTDVEIAGVEIAGDDSLELHFPKANPFFVGEAVTIHLDDRSGSELYSIELRVYRCSYKGVVTRVSGTSMTVAPVDFTLVYSTRVVATYRIPSYSYPVETRPIRALEVSPLTRFALPDEKERENKLGVWITRAMGRPHTTVMAFLSSENDDIFLITQAGTFKYENILRDPDCCFAIDHRGSFQFDRAIDWNYTIFKARAHTVPSDHAIFAEVQARFVEKNPWEIAFFSDPEIRMFHLAPEKILYADIIER